MSWRDDPNHQDLSPWATLPATGATIKRWRSPAADELDAAQLDQLASGATVLVPRQGGARHTALDDIAQRYYRNDR